MRSGPVQLLVVGFDRPDFSGEVLAEFERLRESVAVRVIDLLVVHKGADGVVRRLEHSDLTTGGDEGVDTVVGALIGLDAQLGAPREEPDRGSLPAEEEFWSLDEAIRDDSAAVIALVAPRGAFWSLTRGSIRPTSLPPGSPTPRMRRCRMADAIGRTLAAASPGPGDARAERVPTR